MHYDTQVTFSVSAKLSERIRDEIEFAVKGILLDMLGKQVDISDFDYATYEYDEEGKLLRITHG